ncbi:hypothetical protein PV327_003294 [Microctonus hyperodae]|uniref:DUF4604 domain-containing protein n=1 Tax=Microctonus hyperodae TaxID=165561 RepID=A0AA39L0R4_MICHY|nr:hypothetical protein PV327_003294 [Microctonus hyperodae]
MSANLSTNFIGMKICPYRLMSAVNCGYVYRNSNALIITLRCKKPFISYIKPQEPKFLRELKAQAGFKEGPNIDTKRGDPSAFEDWDDNDDETLPCKTEEEPVVVVLNAGDLTAEEVEAFKKTKEEEEANTPADLTKRVIFNRKSKASDNEEIIAKDQPMNKKKKISKRPIAVLSFTELDEENE